jgi:hypothetical protein
VLVARSILPEPAVDPAPVEPVQIEPLPQGLDGLELVADGLEIPGVHGFDQSFQVLAHVEWGRIASSQEGPGAATVFRRCPASPPDTERIAPLRLLRELPLDPDLVLPGIAEVTLVEEAFVAAELEVGEANLVGILGEPGPSRPTDAVIPGVDAEAMEVGVGPAEGDLERVMELGQGAVGAHQEPPPDHGADLPDPDVELVDLGRRLIGRGKQRRASIICRSLFAFLGAVALN